MKTHLPVLDMIFRGLYAGFFLGITASFNFQLTAITGNAMTGGLLFFAGFMMIIFYGFELVTGNMLVIPLALMARRASWLGAVKNILIVYWSNFAGCMLAVSFFYGSFTHFGLIAGTSVKSGPSVIASAKGKTIDYYNDGGLGWCACFFKGIMCNFLVSFAVLGSIVSTSTTGKVAACWFPVAMFAVLGYEHVVVNMYTTPMSMCLGSGISQGLFWGWSIAPSTLGNLVGAILLVATPMWVTHGHEYRQRQREAKQADKLTKSSSSDALMDIETASPTTNYPEGSFEEQAPEGALYDQITTNNSIALPNTPNAQHY
eukprot:GGOE01025320.1.p1 GENE.GGOE01025320.1~~GGOE01025320.1.p1  ORF type:complete len:349 (-),score=47.00 GGOE01025320.1:391-1338(-)